MDYQSILNAISREVAPLHSEGIIPSYIPELAKTKADRFAIHLISTSGDQFMIGHHKESFSIQSISKVFSLALSFSIKGESLWKRVGVEPSGNPFNSIVQLEYERGIPRNPFVNAGALVTADILISHLKEPKKDFIDFVRQISGTSTISYNQSIAASEKKFGYLNAALANMLKSHGNIQNEVDEVLDFYFHQCSVEMSCEELAKAFLPFAKSELSYRNRSMLTSSQVKRINAIMMSCGFYDESGEFAFSVGLAGKSGVGGGIAAVYPNHYSVAVWSPRLNEKGNSVMGMKALELLTTKTGMSIF